MDKQEHASPSSYMYMRVSASTFSHLESALMATPVFLAEGQQKAPIWPQKNTIQMNKIKGEHDENR